MVTPEVAAALDRTGTSSRSATYILAAVAKSMADDPSEYNIHPMSIHREREKCRAKRFEDIKSDLKGSGPLTVHWDGKLMEDLTPREHIDRLPVLISFGGEEQLLAVPKLLQGTGEAQADAIMTNLNEWGGS